MADATPVQVVEGSLDALNKLDLAGMLATAADERLRPPNDCLTR